MLVLLQQKALRKLNGCPRQPASSFSKKRFGSYTVAPGNQLPPSAKSASEAKQLPPATSFLLQ